MPAQHNLIETMKTYIKNTEHGRLAAECFADIYEFSEALKRPVNKVFADQARKSFGDSYYRREFAGTATYAEADDLLRNGYDVGARKLQSIGSFIDKAERPRTELSPVGFAPHVPNAIQGVPYAMINRANKKNDVPVIRLYYSMGWSYKITTDTIIESSRLLLDVISHIERTGTRVELFLFFGSKAGKCSHQETIYPVIKLKEASQPINLLKLAYIIVHPSFLRRHCLCYMETAPIMTSRSFIGGYGCPLSLHADAEYIRKDMSDLGIVKAGEKYAVILSADLKSAVGLDKNQAETILEKIKNQLK